MYNFAMWLAQKPVFGLYKGLRALGDKVWKAYGALWRWGYNHQFHRSI
jgi:hypothetical protein